MTPSFALGVVEFFLVDYLALPTVTDSFVAALAFPQDAALFAGDDFFTKLPLFFPPHLFFNKRTKFFSINFTAPKYFLITCK